MEHRWSVTAAPSLRLHLRLALQYHARALLRLSLGLWIEPIMLVSILYRN